MKKNKKVLSSGILIREAVIRIVFISMFVTSFTHTFAKTITTRNRVSFVSLLEQQDQEQKDTLGVSADIYQNPSKDVSVEPQETEELKDVVVVGYGTQKKSVVTGSISSVKAKDLEKAPNSRVDQALQGRVSGVTIAASSGSPGSASTVRVRGVTTFGDGGNNPLWVVDGIVVDAGGIGFLNQSDIESIEVLKDAASAAIYGTRAATGVILVTTKKGKPGKMTVNYNAFAGVSSAAKTLDMLNATQYGTIMNEKSIAAGGGLVYPDAQSLGVGTDWQAAIFNNNAYRYSHELSLSGGSDASTFYASVGIQDQQGIVMKEISEYSKNSFRLNSTHKISKVFSFGQTLGYTGTNTVGIGNTNSEYGGPLSSAINLDPVTPLVVTDPAVANASPYSINKVIRDGNGNPYGISEKVGQEMTNPKAYAQTRLGGYDWSKDFVGNAYVEAAFLKHFKFKSVFNAKMASWGNKQFTPVYYLTAMTKVDKNNYAQTNNESSAWNVENVLTYSNKLGVHSFTALLGQGSYVENMGGKTSVTLFGIPTNNYKEASFNFIVPSTDKSATTEDFVEHKLTSLFGRLNYNYDEKYLFTGIIRRDGSSRFGANNKFGVFPSFNLGWVVSKENFWKQNDVVNILKVRGGYGVVGNDAIPDFRYLSLINGGYNYPIGNPSSINTGYANKTLDNPDLHWEETSQADIGIDTRLFNSLGVTLDFYKKRTTGILRSIVIPGYVGVTDNPTANVADMNNTGVELELDYKKQFGELNFSINGNISFLKNEVTYVASDVNYIGGDASFMSMGQVTRTEVGQSYNSFYGYKTNGIFQSEEDVKSYTNASGNIIQPDAKQGDFRWIDTDGNGKIEEADKQYLGTSIPKYTYGITLNLDFKGFDFMAFMNGAGGSKIFQGLRRLDILNANYQTTALNRWVGEGTSNDYPRLTNDDTNGNFNKMSEFYLEDGGYIRLKLVQFGYSIPKNIISVIGATRLRLYITGENLLTFTKYTGFDPEIGGSVFGVDKGVYPQARTFMAGLNLQF